MNVNVGNMKKFEIELIYLDIPKNKYDKIDKILELKTLSRYHFIL